MSEDYIYAVARIRSAEMKLLNSTVLESMLSANTYDDCLRLLSDHGWSVDDNVSLSSLLKSERDRTWKFISEFVPDLHAFDVFLYANDYHNLKAAIKAVYGQTERDDIYLDKEQCSVDPEIIKKAIQKREFTLLPEFMRTVAEEALDTLLRTGDGGLCDIIIDKAALDKIYEAGKKANNPIFGLYSELTVASANIKTAIRACHIGKDFAFLDKALSICDSLDISKLKKAAAENLEAVYEYLSHTVYSDAVSEIKNSPSAFERWCDNRIMASIRPERHNPFTIGPLAAYILAKENEIKSVRIILSGKINNLPADSLRERVREMYV